MRTVGHGRAVFPLGAAHAATGDAVVGQGAAGFATFDIDASGGPSGENPTGHSSSHNLSVVRRSPLEDEPAATSLDCAVRLGVELPASGACPAAEASNRPGQREARPPRLRNPRSASVGAKSAARW
jgi:hypothetical protein